MEAALGQPLNERFVLLSENCIPLYPASLVWAQLLSQPLSRIHACAKPGDADDENRRMLYRWESTVFWLVEPCQARGAVCKCAHMCRLFKKASHSLGLLWRNLTAD